MKQTNDIWALLAAGLLSVGAAAANLQAQTSDPALNALVKKGILTEQEAKAALADTELAKKSKPADQDARIFWKEGLNFQSADGKTFKGKLGGRLDVGMGLFSEDAATRSLPGVGDIPSGVEFRRARLALEGEYTPANSTLSGFYKVEVDFAAAGPNAGDATSFSLKDVYLGVSGLPTVGTVQAGHFKEPIGLELLTSSRYLTFIERSLPTEAFAPERNTGIALANSALGERMTWALGAFTDVGNSGNGNTDSDYKIDARLSGLPWYDEDAKGSKFLHLGVSASYINPDGSVRYRTRPEAHLAPRFVDVTIPSDQTFLAAAEAALVFGPFSLQAEYFRTWVDTIPSGSATFDGFYAQGSWFITGEHRAYKRSNGTFDRLRPASNLSLTGGGLGAWEVAARYSSVNLNDSSYTGGRLNDITAGLNWYLNPNMKIQLNYTLAMVNRAVSGVDHDGDTHIFQTLLHVDF